MAFANVAVINSSFLTVRYSRVFDTWKLLTNVFLTALYKSAVIGSPEDTKSCGTGGLSSLKIPVTPAVFSLVIKLFQKSTVQ